MLYYENGDIVKDEKYRIICHQINCKGVMGAGLAKQIRDKWPQVYDEYKNIINKGESVLGHIMISHEFGVNGREIVGLFAQDGYGRDKRYTDYDAFKHCLDVMADEVNYLGLKNWPNIAFPYGIGCGLAGGDWRIIEPMLKEFSEKVKQKVIIVKYKKVTS